MSLWSIHGEARAASMGLTRFSSCGILRDNLGHATFGGE
jgi:hypothetical protein